MLAIHPETSYWATLWLSFLFCKMWARVGATRDLLLASSHCDSLKDHQAKGLSNGSINLVSKHLKNFTLKLYSPLIENKWQLSVVLHPGFKTACQVWIFPAATPQRHYSLLQPSSSQTAGLSADLSVYIFLSHFPTPIHEVLPCSLFLFIKTISTLICIPTRGKT